MTEAVIVATARTPIGRAFKGSLKDVRPDDLAVQVVQAAARARCPAWTRPRIDDLYWGCADPSGKHGVEHRAGSSRSSLGMDRCRPRR